MTTAPTNIAGPDRLAALRTAAAVQQPINVSFAGRPRGLDAANITSLSSLFDRLAASRPSAGRFSAFEAEATRTTDAISAALNTRLGGDDFTTILPTAVTAFEGKGFDFANQINNALRVEVTQSAQQASVYLSLGLSGSGSAAGQLDLGGAGQASNSTFQIEISGGLGTRQLSFSSGSTLRQIVNAINTFVSDTGVEAVFNSAGNAGGILLRSTEFGSREFVSVEVLNDGGIVNQTGSDSTLGLYGTKADDASIFTGIDPSAFVAIGLGGASFSDIGQDIAGMIDRLPAIGRGTTLAADLTGGFSRRGGFARVTFAATPSPFDADAQTLGVSTLFIFPASSPRLPGDPAPNPTGLPRTPLNVTG